MTIRILGGVALLTLAIIGCTKAADEPIADEAATAEAATKLADEWQSDYDTMARVLPLSPAESTALRSAFEEMQRDLQAWIDGPDGQRLIDLESQLPGATERRDLAGVQAIIEQAKPLRTAFTDRIASHKAALIAALSPQNQLQWKGHRLAEHMVGLMEPIALRPDQEQAIRANAPAAMQDAENRREANPPAAAFLALEGWAEEAVLTPDQREAYAQVKRAHAMRSLTF